MSQYTREVSLCFRMASSYGSAFRLALSTLEFHARNALKLRNDRATVPSTYGMRIGNKEAAIGLRTRTGDLFVFHEVFLSECYALPAKVLEGSRTIVDLGANVGLTTLFLAHRAPHAKFVCVEPDPENLVLLSRNVAVLGQRVTVVGAAIAAASGRGRLDTSSASWGGRMTPAGDTEVDTLSMPALLERCAISEIDVLKVDIEGAEVELFADCAGWIERVGIVIIELHEPYTIERFRADLEPHGFAVYEPGQKLGNRMVIAARRGLRVGPEH